MWLATPRPRAPPLLPSPVTKMCIRDSRKGGRPGLVWEEDVLVETGVRYGPDSLE